MNAFDKVIGYEAIKNELLQICDMIHNREVYEKLGAKLPKGILLYGAPGLGKTLIAKCFIEESGLKSYVVRRNKGNDDFIGDITATFQKARETAPCIVFLDDMDKFANEDSNHRDAEEYVAVQSGIDEVKNCNVFVLATANEMWKLPNSLVRSGRFDRKIEVQCPTAKDAENSISLDYVKSGMILAGLSKPEHIKIWLDDVREAPEGYCRCHSVNETKETIMACEKESAVIDEINCDHDLGDYAFDGGDGIKLIDWLAERKTHYPVKLHTMNPVGRENMQREIDRYWNERK